MGSTCWNRINPPPTEDCLPRPQYFKHPRCHLWYSWKLLYEPYCVGSQRLYRVRMLFRPGWFSLMTFIALSGVDVPWSYSFGPISASQKPREEHLTSWIHSLPSVCLPESLLPPMLTLSMRQRMTSWLHNTPAPEARTVSLRGHSWVKGVGLTSDISGSFLGCGEKEPDSSSGSSVHLSGPFILSIFEGNSH